MRRMFVYSHTSVTMRPKPARQDSLAGAPMRTPRSHSSRSMSRHMTARVTPMPAKSQLSMPAPEPISVRPRLPPRRTTTKLTRATTA